jgi:hypothetical protein
MYLEVQSVTLPTGTLVELEFECQGREWLVPAIVVHHAGNGVGVMFRDPQAGLFKALIQPETAARPPQAAPERAPLHRF